ncbi:hypothetical protein [Massilia consociata]|uniref:hypothetical protein n=1 Tax=Massilia consociata TaxID=760117 RepID=UPI0036D39737
MTAELAGHKGFQLENDEIDDVASFSPLIPYVNTNAFLQQLFLLIRDIGESNCFKACVVAAKIPQCETESAHCGKRSNRFGSRIPIVRNFMPYHEMKFISH